MDVEQVRSFNRTVTERVGALQDAYLGRGRPLGANRVLWEIGDGTDLRTLRARLGLDSGYLSRLIGVASARRPGRDRARARQARARRSRSPPPAAPSAQLLDQRSDELARDLLAPLSRQQRDAGSSRRWRPSSGCSPPGLVEITAEDQDSADARYCLARVLQGARRALRRRLRRSASLPDRRRRLPRRAPARRAGRLRRDQARATATSSACGSPRRRAALASGGGCCTSSSSSRGPRRRPAGDQPRAAGGDPALPRVGLRRGRAVQRRALRPPLVREAPLNILPPHARDRPLPDLQGLRRPRPLRGRHRRRHRRGRRPRPGARARRPLRQAHERAQGRPRARHAPVGARAGRALPRRARRRGRARRRRRDGRDRDGLLARRLARPRRRADVHRQPQPEGLHGREDGRARLGRALRRPRADTRSARTSRTASARPPAAAPTRRSTSTRTSSARR